MLFTYSKKTKSITISPITDFSSHHLLERRDLEKWLEKDPEILGEELLIITSEYDQFVYTKERLDLLAVDRDGNLVIIELKRDSAGKSVELQALKYAAYCSNITRNKAANLYREYRSKRGEGTSLEDAKNKIDEFIQNDEFEEFNDKPRIVLMSKEFSPEVIASVLWLRKFMIDIKCIKLTPYLLDDETIGIESNIIIPLPEAADYLKKSEEKEDVESERSLTKEAYVNFFQDLSQRLASALGLSVPAPLPRSYYQIPTQKPGVHFELAFHGRPRNRFGVELHFERGQKKLNEALINRVERIKSNIEGELASSLTIQKDWGRSWARAYIEKTGGEMTDELKNWAVDKMKILYKFLEPEIAKWIDREEE